MSIHVPAWFYVFTGAVLAATGVIQLVLRARDAEARRPLAMAAAVLFVVLGALVVYYGLAVHR